MKNKSRYFWGILILCAMIIGSVGLYSFFIKRNTVTDEELTLRLERRSTVFEKNYLKNPNDFRSHLQYIDRSNELVEQAIKRHPTNSWSYYYQALFATYELNLRVRFDYETLYELLSRSFLPPLREWDSDQEFEQQNQRIEILSKTIVHAANKSLALGATVKAQKSCDIMFIMGKLFYTGRADRQEYERIRMFSGFEPNSTFLQYHLLWFQIFLHSFYNDNKFPYKDALNKIHLSELFLEEASLGKTMDLWKQLLLARIYFALKNYNESYDLARLLLVASDEQRLHTRETYLLIAEIFYIQRNKQIAIEYLNKALAITNDSGASDPYIEKVLEKWL